MQRAWGLPQALCAIALPGGACSAYKLWLSYEFLWYFFTQPARSRLPLESQALFSCVDDDQISAIMFRATAKILRIVFLLVGLSLNQ